VSPSESGALSHRAPLDRRGQASGSLPQQSYEFELRTGTARGSFVRRAVVLRKPALYTAAKRLGHQEPERHLLDSHHVAGLEGSHLRRSIGRCRPRGRVHCRAREAGAGRPGTGGAARELRSRCRRERDRRRHDLYGADAQCAAQHLGAHLTRTRPGLRRGDRRQWPRGDELARHQGRG
jgi:hypothetical protein